jgi:hypothetical protein
MAVAYRRARPAAVLFTAWLVAALALVSAAHSSTVTVGDRAHIACSYLSDAEVSSAIGIPILERMQGLAISDAWDGYRLVPGCSWVSGELATTVDDLGLEVASLPTVADAQSFFDQVTAIDVGPVRGHYHPVQGVGGKARSLVLSGLLSGVELVVVRGRVVIGIKAGTNEGGPARPAGSPTTTMPASPPKTAAQWLAVLKPLASVLLTQVERA